MHYAVDNMPIIHAVASGLFEYGQGSGESSAGLSLVIRMFYTGFTHRVYLECH